MFAPTQGGAVETACESCQASIYPARAMTTRPTVGCVLRASAYHLLVRLYAKTAQLAPTPPRRVMMQHRTVSGAKQAHTLPWQERGVQTRQGRKPGTAASALPSVFIHSTSTRTGLREPQATSLAHPWRGQLLKWQGAPTCLTPTTRRWHHTECC